MHTAVCPHLKTWVAALTVFAPIHHTARHITNSFTKEKGFFKLLKPDKIFLAHLAMGKGLLCYTVQNIHCDRVPALSHKYHVSSFPESSL